MDIGELLLLAELQQIVGNTNSLTNQNQTSSLFADLLQIALQESADTPQTVTPQQPSGITEHLNASAGSPQLDRIVENSSEKYGVDPSLIMQVIKAESNGNTNAVSNAGAEGLMQLMPGTATSYGVTNSFDAAQNVDAGTHYLKDLLQRFHGNVALALAGYNAGPGAVEKYNGIPPYQETQNYVKKIMQGLSASIDTKA